MHPELPAVQRQDSLASIKLLQLEAASQQGEDMLQAVADLTLCFNLGCADLASVTRDGFARCMAEVISDGIASGDILDLTTDQSKQVSLDVPYSGPDSSLLTTAPPSSSASYPSPYEYTSSARSSAGIAHLPLLLSVLLGAFILVFAHL